MRNWITGAAVLLALTGPCAGQAMDFNRTIDPEQPTSTACRPAAATDSFAYCLGIRRATPVVEAAQLALAMLDDQKKMRENDECVTRMMKKPVCPRTVLNKRERRAPTISEDRRRNPDEPGTEAGRPPFVDQAR